jgi:hypothetical protein
VDQNKESGYRPPLQQNPEPDSGLVRLVKTFDVRQLTIRAEHEPINVGLPPVVEAASDGIVRGERPSEVARMLRLAQLVSDELPTAGPRILSGVSDLVYRETVRSLLAAEEVSASEATAGVLEERSASTLSSFAETLSTTVQEALDLRRIAQRAGQALAANIANWVPMPSSADSHGKPRDLPADSKGLKTSERGEGIITQTVLAGDRRPEASLPVHPTEIVERVRPRFEPPPPPPVARHVAIEIGEADSQVNVVIRERNGDLAIQFGAATERLRENLQNAAPLLLHQLQREAAHAPAVQLNFSSFGSATDADRNAHQDRREKKPLKSGADFAALEELTSLGSGDANDKLLEFRNLDN